MKYITITYPILLMLFIVSGCAYINKTGTSESEATGSTIDTEKQDVLDILLSILNLKNLLYLFHIEINKKSTHIHREQKLRLYLRKHQEK